MGLAIDWYNSIISVTSPTVSVSGQDLHDFVEDEMAAPVGMLYADILKPEGKIEDPTNPGVYSQIILILNSPWQIQFWPGSGYTRIYGAKIVGGLADEPMKATGTAGDITVLESPVDGVTVVSGSGITEQDKDDIADKVWDEIEAESVLYGGVVVFDAVGGSPGTAKPIGTYGEPSNNLTDALTIAAARKIKRILLGSDLTVTASHNIDDFAVETYGGAVGVDVTLETGCSTNDTVFRYLNIRGTVTNGDIVLLEACSISQLYNFTGFMNVVSFAEGSKLSIGQWANLLDCHAGGSAGNEPEVSIGNAALVFNKWTGNLKLTDKTGSDNTVVNMQSGNIIIDSTCIAGKIQLIGNGQLERDDSGPGCQVDEDALIANANIADHVWDELKFEHEGADSFGDYVARILNVTEIKRAKVNDASASTTKFITNLTETANGFWDRASILFSGENSGLIRAVKNYNSSTKEIQVQTPLVAAPIDQDVFIIIPARKFLTPDVIELADAVAEVGKFEETNKLLRNRRITDSLTGLMKIYNDNDVDVLLEAPLYEDVDGTQPYRGQGAERRDKLS